MMSFAGVDCVPSLSFFSSLDQDEQVLSLAVEMGTRSR